MKKIAALLLAAAALAARAEPAAAPNTLTDAERQAGWTLLWDGKTTEGWQGLKGDAVPAKGWTIKDGVLTVTGGGGDIVTAQRYRRFTLTLEAKLTPGANSGIKYFVDLDTSRKEGHGLGLEYQLLDDEKHPDAKMGKDGNRTIGSLYDLIPAAATKKPAPIGEWNQVKIVADGNHVEHWLNGAKVVEFERGSDAFRAIVAGSKFKGRPAFGEAAEGPILLQDHGNVVSFRNIKIQVPAP